MKAILSALLGSLVLVTFISSDVNAASLRVQPLLFNTELAKGEKKRGFIDISNPTSQTIAVNTSVQAFRQVDDNGNLQFYDNEQVTSGVALDLMEFDLGPREVLRMYFLLDGTKLPEGDVFAAIFVSTKANQESKGVAESVRLGTILTIVNGTPGTRDASIESLSASFLQLGGGVNGSFRVRNTADSKVTTGFYPDVNVKLSPLGSAVAVKSPLVMAGRSREKAFSLEGSRLGLYTLEAAYGSSKQSQLVLVITGFWQWVVPLVFGLLVGLIYWKKKPAKKGYYKAR